MWLDVSNLRQFYKNPLGKQVQRLLNRKFDEIWPNLTGQRILVIGYGAPYVGRFGKSPERALLVMPAGQGAVQWPNEKPIRVTLSDERHLPFPDNAFDRVLLIHALEFTEHLRPMLRETWRIVADGGHLLIVVPNRRGIWAQTEGTPFGHGQPYSQSQLHKLLRDCLFLPIRSDAALYSPPSKRRIIRRLSPAWEKIGHRWLRPFSGVVLMEAEKQVYANADQSASTRMLQKNIRPLLGGIAYPTTDSALPSNEAAVSKKTP